MRAMRAHLLLLLLHEAASVAWHPVQYLRLESDGIALGFDDHDPDACAALGHHAPGAATAMCSFDPQSGDVLLRGCVQCLRGVRTCFDDPGTCFASLPVPCRKHAGVVKVVRTTPNDGSVDTGTEVQVETDGRLSLRSPTKDGCISSSGLSGCWMIHLDGMVIHAPPSWGSELLVAIAAATLLGVSVASLWNSQVRGKRGWDVLPALSEARALAGLVRDGVNFARAGFDSKRKHGQEKAVDKAAPLLQARTRRTGVSGKHASIGRAQPLHRAASMGDAATLQALLQGGGSTGTGSHDGLDGGDERKWTALHLACAAGHHACVELLLEAGCDTSLRDEQGLTALEVTEQLQRAPIVPLLTKHVSNGRSG